MPAAPPAGATRPENESFANLVSYVATNVGVLVIRDSIKKGGNEPNEPDPEDIERTTEATAKGIAIALGDAAVPWWASIIASWGSLYLSMRVGARPAANDNAATSPPPAPAPAAAAPVLGQGLPQQRQAKGSSLYQPLPEVATVGASNQ